MLPTRVPRPIELVPVYRLRTPGNTEPDFYLPRTVVMQLIKDGEATPINRGKAARLLFEKPLKIRDESCHPSKDTTEAAAAGDIHAQAIVLMWAFSLTRHLPYHPPPKSDETKEQNATVCPA